MEISKVIIKRIKEEGGSFFANDNISNYLKNGELDLLQIEAEQKFKEFLETLVIDTENDHNTKETAKRVAKMYLREVFSGRYLERPPIKDFPNAKSLDELYTLGPIKLRSACSHHFVEIEGECWIGVQPSERVIGISKFSRLVNWVCQRPHIQEEMAVILADEIESLIKPRGLGIVIKAKHHCMTWRGVKEDSTTMVNSIVRGSLRDSPSLKTEFFEIIKSQGFVR